MRSVYFLVSLNFSGSSPTDWRGKDVVAVIIEQGGKAFRRADAAMMVAFGADRLVFLKFLEENHRVAALAFVPERVGCLALGDEGNGVADAGDPVHVCATFRGVA